MSTVVSHIGLPDKEVTLLASMFSILCSSSKVSDDLVFVREAGQQLADDIKNNTDQNLAFVGNEKRRSPGRMADIVLINGDDNSAIETWTTLKNTNPRTVPIIISSRENKELVAKHALKRPLMLKNLVTILADVTSTKNKTDKSQSYNFNILIVDDSLPVRKYMEQTLPKFSHNNLVIDLASSGEEALEKMANQFYGLVFLDVVMPGMDGYKVCKLIKSNYNSKVVMLTSKKSPFDKVRGMMSGCDAYITKPPKDDKLRSVLEKHLTVENSFAEP